MAQALIAPSDGSQIEDRDDNTTYRIQDAKVVVVEYPQKKYRVAYDFTFRPLGSTGKVSGEFVPQELCMVDADLPEDCMEWRVVLFGKVPYRILAWNPSVGTMTRIQEEVNSLPGRKAEPSEQSFTFPALAA
jgi:hypothetical protein